MQEIISMTQEDRAYFKSGVRTLCGTEVLFVMKVISDPDMKKIFKESDIDFMKKELGRQCGAIWARMVRAFKKLNFKEVERILTGGKGR